MTYQSRRKLKEIIKLERENQDSLRKYYDERYQEQAQQNRDDRIAVEAFMILNPELGAAYKMADDWNGTYYDVDQFLQDARSKAAEVKRAKAAADRDARLSGKKLEE